MKPVGQGVSEYRINWGPGYRIYFGADGADLIVLLGGGSKQGQQGDMATAQDHWDAYRKRKAAERRKAEKETKAKEPTRRRKKKV